MGDGVAAQPGFLVHQRREQLAGRDAGRQDALGLVGQGVVGLSQNQQDGDHREHQQQGEGAQRNGEAAEPRSNR